MRKRKTPAEWQAREALIWSIIALIVSIGVMIFKLAS